VATVVAGDAALVDASAAESSVIDAAVPAGTESAAVVGEAARATPTVTATAPGDTWVLPVDATCPVSHPVKANESSGIYHLPGGLSYDRVVPERCYRTPADAESDGFRAAKR
jgi:hypothetical protein